MPIAACTVLVSKPGDSELKTQELILAELTCRRGYDAGSETEKQGLRNENALLRTWLGREITRGDKLDKIDANSQKMDTNSTRAEQQLEARIAEKDKDLATANSRLQSCQDNQKWIAGLSFAGGFGAGYFVKGKAGSILPNTGLYRIDNSFPAPRPFDLPKLFQTPVPSYLRPYVK